MATYVPSGTERCTIMRARTSHALSIQACARDRQNANMPNSNPPADAEKTFVKCDQQVHLPDILLLVCNSRACLCCSFMLAVSIVFADHETPIGALVWQESAHNHD
jgi:hypothetical protein